VRTLRDPKAEREETLLLGQLHELRAAAAACAQSKWCVVLGCCGESVAVCGVQKPINDADTTTADGDSGTTDSATAAATAPVELLLFDPCARPVSTATYIHNTYTTVFVVMCSCRLLQRCFHAFCAHRCDCCYYERCGSLSISGLCFNAA
jgi:hypothetical protein